MAILYIKMVLLLLIANLLNKKLLNKKENILDRKKHNNLN
jgi:hypothetical protein